MSGKRTDRRLPNETKSSTGEPRTGLDGLARNLLLLAGTRPVVETLEAHGIESVALKGLGLLLAGRDERFTSRAMADVDLLVRPECCAEAEAILTALGFARIPGHQSTYQLDRGAVPIRIDLHDRIWYLDQKGLEAFFERSTEVERYGLRVAVPSTEDHLLLVATHAVLLHGQLRPKWLEDLTELIAAGPDWDLLVAMAKKTRLDVPLHAALERLSADAAVDVPSAALESLRPRHLGRVRSALIQRVLSRPETPETGHVLRLLHRRGTSAKLRALRSHLFPRREFLRRRYGENARGWRVRRPFAAIGRGLQLLARHAGIAPRRSGRAGAAR